MNLTCWYVTIQLSTGDLKRVESLSTEDFIRSAKSSPEVKIDQSTVTAIEPCNDRGTVIITFSVGKDKVQVRSFVCQSVRTQMDKRNGILALFRCKMAFFKRSWLIIKVVSRP